MYGQSGLEAALDDYLRGLKGNSARALWWNHLLYGQPPPGLDVRLSLDLGLQRTADEQLGEHAGALALLNAETGEILAIASHPTFDANHIGTELGKPGAKPARPAVRPGNPGVIPARRRFWANAPGISPGPGQSANPACAPSQPSWAVEQ